MGWICGRVWGGFNYFFSLKLDPIPKGFFPLALTLDSLRLLKPGFRSEPTTGRAQTGLGALVEANSDRAKHFSWQKRKGCPCGATKILFCEEMSLFVSAT